MTRTTDPSARPRRKRSTKAATTKIVLSGCSAGVALGIVGAMTIAESAAPVAEPAFAAIAPGTPPTTPVETTLPPKRIVTYVYRQVIVPDAPSDGTRAARPAPPTRAVAAPAPRPAPRTPSRTVAPTTTTTQAS